MKEEFVHELNTLVSVIGCTTFLRTNGHTPEDVHPEHTLVGGLNELKDELIGARAVRELIVPPRRRGCSSAPRCSRP